MIKSAIALATALSLVFSPLSWAGTTSASQDIESFVTRTQDQLFAYELTHEELISALNDRGNGGAYAEQIQKALEKSQGSQDSLLQLKELEARERAQAEAFNIIDKMFRQQSIEQMNLDLLSILHDYLFIEEARGPLHILIEQIERYNFSPEQMRELRKQATTLKQYTNGSLAAFAVITAGALLSIKDRGRSLRKYFAKTSKSVPKATANSASANNAPAISEVEAMLARLHKLGVKNTLEAAPVIERKKLFASLTNFTQKGTFKNFAYVTGASVVGGTANVGFNALNRALFNEDISDSYINPKDLKSDHYDGLAVLSLSCRAHDLLQSVSDMSQIEALKSLNALYGEYILLTRLAPRYLEKVLLSDSVRANGELGEVSLHLEIQGHMVSETVPCPMVAGRADTRVEVSLVEVLYQISDVFLKLAHITE